MSDKKTKLKPIWLKPDTIQLFNERGTCGQTQDELMNYLLDTLDMLHQDLGIADKKIEILEKENKKLKEAVKNDND